jgi:hypothetical protein
MLLPPIKQDAPRPLQPQKNVEIGDIGRQQREAELLGVQQEHAVVQGAQLVVGRVALEVTDDAGEQGGASQDASIAQLSCIRHCLVTVEYSESMYVASSQR